MDRACEAYCEAASYEEIMDALTEAALDYGDDEARAELPNELEMWLMLMRRAAPYSGRVH
jgi:anti-sigma factor RsiW